MAKSFDPCLMVLTLATVSSWIVNVAARRVNYPDVGTFDTRLRCNKFMLPQSPSEVNTKFYLYTNRQNKSLYEIIDFSDDGSIINSNFLASGETKFIIHGFTDSFKLERFQSMKDDLLEIGNLNVIMVNWEDGASASPGGIPGIHKFLGWIAKYMGVSDQAQAIEDLHGYLKARQNARLVGRQIGLLSRKLEQLTNASFTRMHLIGHSLGAHVAGFAGEYISGKSGNYSRITGLDPAGPWYEAFRAIPGCLLEKTDAKFVDIIHTSTVFGNEEPVGHQDFYPDGGLMQDSCLWYNLTCNHDKSVDYFIESINSNCSWRAYPCTDWSYFEDGLCEDCREKGCPWMGYYAEPPATGVFMLEVPEKNSNCTGDSG